MLDGNASLKGGATHHGLLEINCWPNSKCLSISPYSSILRSSSSRLMFLVFSFSGIHDFMYISIPWPDRVVGRGSLASPLSRKAFDSFLAWMRVRRLAELL